MSSGWIGYGGTTPYCPPIVRYPLTPVGHRRHHQLKRFVFLVTGWRSGSFSFVSGALTEDRPPIGTYPAGSEGSTVTIGAAVPLTGAYADSGG